MSERPSATETPDDLKPQFGLELGYGADSGEMGVPPIAAITRPCATPSAPWRWKTGLGQPDRIAAVLAGDGHHQFCPQTMPAPRPLAFRC